MVDFSNLKACDRQLLAEAMVFPMTAREGICNKCNTYTRFSISTRYMTCDTCNHSYDAYNHEDEPPEVERYSMCHCSGEANRK